MPLIKKKSKIHGYGLFSTEFIPRGSVIGAFSTTPAIYATKFSIWVDDEHLRATNILKYSNHSSTPNASVSFPDMIALQDIRPGVEITWEYGASSKEHKGE